LYARSARHGPAWHRGIYQNAAARAVVLWGMSNPTGTGTGGASPHNLFGFDYRQKAAELGPPPLPAGVLGVIDAHTHIHGEQAARLYDRVRRMFGVNMTYTMTQLSQAQTVKDVLGESIRFISIPSWGDADKNAAHRHGYLHTIEQFATRFGARMCKIWASPRLREFVPDGAADLSDIDSPQRREHCKLAESLGMMFMVHVADPDTWFAAKYRDGGTFGTKAHQYVGLERMLDLFPRPWIAAHMGGWPEDLKFLDSMLTRHPNLHIDTSATKWVVRELSKHPREEVVGFFNKWQGRVLFGTDLVVMEDQLSPQKSLLSAMGDLSSSAEGAFDLYSSRHWALRTMFETLHQGPSPIADPDLHMVDPDRFSKTASPALRGLGLPREVLETLYFGAADRLINRWWTEHGGW